MLAISKPDYCSKCEKSPEIPYLIQFEFLHEETRQYYGIQTCVGCYSHLMKAMHREGDQMSLDDSWIKYCYEIVDHPNEYEEDDEDDFEDYY